jgi:hypothetical protein
MAPVMDVWPEYRDPIFFLRIKMISIRSIHWLSGHSVSAGGPKTPVTHISYGGLLVFLGAANVSFLR